LQRKAVATRAVDDDENQFCVWLAEHGCVLRIVDTFAQSALSDENDQDDDSSTCRNSGSESTAACKQLQQQSDDEPHSKCGRRAESPTDSFESEYSETIGDDDDQLDAKDSDGPTIQMNDDQQLTSITSGTWRPSDAKQQHEARYGDKTYCCYLLQSLYMPSRTYVGMTNNRFQRLRRHNGEITGGARATRAYRPWRMVAFVDGFGHDKNAALRFEWSWRHPRKRRLCKPWHRRDGRLNCARQVLQSEEWRDWPLRLVALPDAHCSTHAQSATMTSTSLSGHNMESCFVDLSLVSGTDRRRVDSLIVSRALHSEQE